MKCPDCGSELKLMFYNINDSLETVIMFNCENCTRDWEAVISLSDLIKLKPKFWG